MNIRTRGAQATLKIAEKLKLARGINPTLSQLKIRLSQPRYRRGAEFPDCEGGVTRTVTNSVAWLHDTNASYAQGLDLAETAANILEANQLVAMHDLPSRRVMLFHREPPNPAVLRELLAVLVNNLEPYRRGPQAR